MGGDAGYKRWELGDWKSRYCPRQQITAESYDWIRLYKLFKAGHLLCAGGLLDQPAIYVSVMSILETIVAKASSK